MSIGGALLAAMLGQQPVAEAIEIERGTPCLEVERLATHVQTWYGESEVDERIEIHIGTLPDDRVRVRVGAIERMVTMPDNCDDAHAAIGLAIAVELQKTDLPEAEPRPRRRVGFALDASGVLSAGVHGRGGGGGGLLGLRILPRPAIELGLVALTTTGRPATLDDGTVREVIAAGGVVTCLWVPPRLNVGACATGYFGAGIGRGRDLPDRDLGRKPWFAVAAGPIGLVPLGPHVALRVSADLVVPFSRPRYRAGDARTAHRSPVGAQFALGFRFEISPR